jgi:hypothetical protein
VAFIISVTRGELSLSAAGSASAWIIAAQTSWALCETGNFETIIQGDVDGVLCSERLYSQYSQVGELQGEKFRSVSLMNDLIDKLAGL